MPAELLSDESLKAASVASLRACRTRIDAELSARGYTRTASSQDGELMERVVADAYSGRLTAPGTQSADVVLEDGRTIQVKHRKLPAGDLRHWPFASLDFDLAVVINVDRATNEIVWAREIAKADLEVLVSPHARNGWRLSMSRGRDAGTDVTDRLRAAYEAL